MRRVHSIASRAMLQGLLLVLAVASTARAQNGVQKDQPFYRAKPADAVKTTGAAESPASASVSNRIEKEGIAIDFSIKALPGEQGKAPGLVAGADALVSFRVTDTRTGQPVTGLHPNGWFTSRKSDRAPNEAECKDKIKTFLGGLLSARAEMDLNSYTLVTLNHDNTVTFINPQVAFSVTKLEGIVELPGAGVDWALSKDKNFLYVTMPDQSAVAIINTINKKLIGTISTGEKSKPARIALQPDGRYIWVGLDDSPEVAVIDIGTNKLASKITVGAGLHNIAFTSDSRFAYVTNSAADTVSAIDIKALSKVADIAVGKTPVPVAYSSASNTIHVASINGATISVIDAAKQQVVKTIPVKRGVVALKFDLSGRYGFAVNQIEGVVSVIDASTNQIVASGEVVKGPDQITFTKSYAYVRGTGSEKFSLLELSEVKKGKITPVDIQAGRQPASASPQDIGVAEMITATPEGNSVMIANAPDQMTYYYVEGMMAPMGTFDNYRRRAHALMLIDRSLLETAPGVYTSPVKFKHAGTFDVPVLIDQPRMINCFEVKVADSPGSEKIRAQSSTMVEAMFNGKQFKRGEPVTLRFKITDSITNQAIKGLNDVQVLVFEPPGIWQQRVWAKEVGDGIYEVSQVFPRLGYFKVLTQIQSRGVRFASLPAASVGIVTETKSAEVKDVKKETSAKNE